MKNTEAGLARRIEHIKTVLTCTELRLLCFDLAVDSTHFENEDAFVFASNLLRYLEETNQLELLIHNQYLAESMAKEVSEQSMQLIRLHEEMMANCDKETVFQICEDIPITRLQKFQELDKRDFYREIIQMAKRKGHLSALKSALEKACTNIQFDSFHASIDKQDIESSGQKDELLAWIKNQASLNDLAHLAFLLGHDFENFTWPGQGNAQGEIDFVDYFEKRNRLHQVVLVKRKLVKENRL